MCRTYYDVSNADEFREKIGQKRRVSIIFIVCVALIGLVCAGKEL